MSIAYAVTGRSRRNIRNIVYGIRRQVGLEDELYFPILQFTENVLPTLNPDFQFEVVCQEEMKNKHGETFPDKNIIRIREDVYQRAYEGSGMDRMTIAHEVGHLFLHQNESFSLPRLAPAASIPAFEDPKWQAKVFGGELLAPAYLICGMKEYEIQEACGISSMAAHIQLQHCPRR